MYSLKNCITICSDRKKHDEAVAYLNVLSIRQIADEFLSSKEAVRTGLISAGIRLREACKPHGRQAQPKYGQRKVNESVDEYKREQKIIKAVAQMRDQGLSLRQIAKNMSAMVVPTKCNGTKWHPEMVKRLLAFDIHI